MDAQSFFQRKSKKFKSLQVLHSMSEMNMHHMKVDEGDKSVEEVINDLNGDSQVEYAEPNYIVSKAEAQGYQAEAYYSLAQVQSFNGTMTTAPIENTQAQAAMVNSGVNPIVVAVIDTGLDFTHPVFQNTVWTNPGEIAGNGIDDDGNGYVDDVHGWNFVSGNNNPTDDEGHGTHVSGIVLGIGQNIFTNPVPKMNILIMPLKFLDSSGNGSNANAVSAIYYAANMGAKVMNNSWGGGSYSQAIVDAIHYAYNKDSVFVAAAGNASTNNDTAPTYPASYNTTNEIPVAASDSTDVLAYFSNYGASTVPVTAPGVNILSTYPTGQYAQMSGTSMATPMIAGTVALMRQQRPQMNAYQIKQIVNSTVDVKSNLSGYVSSSGRVNVLTAVNGAQNSALSTSEPAFTSSGSASGSGSSSTMGCGLVSVVGQNAFKTKDTEGMTKELVVVLALLLLPVFLTIALRKPATGAQRRRHERFNLDSTVSFKIGDQEMSGSVKTISVGGSDLNTEALLKDGSVLSMTISSPDGKSQIQVQGHVVWSEKNKRYGVAFDKVGEDITQEISSWTKGLSKAS